jgi:hypothetical protein
MATSNQIPVGQGTLVNTSTVSGVWPGQNTTITPYHGPMLSSHTTQPNPTAHFSVERVDNGFILRSGRFNGDISKTKVCSSIEEVKDLFVAVLVEYQLEK